MGDLDLLNEYVSVGNEDAFERLVSRHVNLVYSVALRRTGNPSAAQDITQAVFVLLAQKAARLGKDTILPAWLHQTTRLTANHWIRTETRRARREQDSSMLTNEPDEDVWAKVSPLLDEAIAELNDKDRHAIMSRFFQGKSLAELGAALGTNEDAAQKRVARAVDKLRDYFIRRGIAVSAGALTIALSANSIQAAPVGLTAIAASGALQTASTATLALAKAVAKMMAWTKLKAAVAAGVAIALVFSASEIASSRVSVNYFAAAPPSSAGQTAAPSTPQTTTTPEFLWANMESADYRQYMANLRAAGFSSNVIRDIILTDVTKAYSKRFSETRGNSRREYWQKHVDQPLSGNQRAKHTAFMREKEDALATLLGETFSNQKFIDIICMQSDDQAATVAWLPPDKRDAARAAFDAAGERDFEMENYFYDSEHKTDVFARRMALLKNILTPEELEEYRLRESPEAAQLRQKCAFTDMSLDEFKAMLQIREHYSPSTVERRESIHAQTEALSAIVGRDRAEELMAKTDFTYSWMCQAAEYYGLPLAAADEALKLKTDTEKTYAQIANDPALSEDEKRSRFKAAQTSARAALIQCLGTNGAAMANNGGGIWLYSDIVNYKRAGGPQL
jgi:RNA polymerase sigma factor (sigma-70 family)